VTPVGGAKRLPRAGVRHLRSRAAPAILRPAGRMTGLRGQPRWTGTGTARVTPAGDARFFTDRGLRSARSFELSGSCVRPSPRKRVAGVELWRSLAAASAVVERRQASALRFQRAPHAACVRFVRHASVGVLPPFFFSSPDTRSAIRDRHSSLLVVPGSRFAHPGYGSSVEIALAKLGRKKTRRENEIAFPPPQRGGGGPREAWWRGPPSTSRSRPSHRPSVGPPSPLRGAGE